MFPSFNEFKCNFEKMDSKVGQNLQIDLRYE